MSVLSYTLNKQTLRHTLTDLTRVGRGEDNDLCVLDESLSRRHAIIRREGDVFKLIDEGSRNGVMYSGQRVASLTLEEGMIFMLGDVEFYFTTDEVEIVSAEPTSAQPVQAAMPETAPPSLPPVAEKPEIATAAPPPPPPVAAMPPPEAETASQPPAGTKAEETQPPAVATVPSNPVTSILAGEESQEAIMAELREAKERILAEISKVIVGQKDILNEVLVALFARGHCR